MAKKTGKKPGRKSQYHAAFAKTLAAMAANPESIRSPRTGEISDSLIAKLVCGGVSAETVRKWRTAVPGRESEYKPAFAAAFKACREAVDADEIKRSMVDRARGFTSRKVTREAVEDKDGKTKMVITKDERTTVAGDVAAARLVLNNIGNTEDRWNTSNKQEIDGSLQVDGLTELLNQMDGSGKQLPGQSDSR